VQLTPEEKRALQALGLSMDFYAVYNILLNGLFVAGFVLVGGVLFWRKSDDRLALYTSFALVTFSLSFIFSQLSTLPPVWVVLVEALTFLGGVSFSGVFYLFPSGRFVPRWSRWLLIGWVFYEGVERFSLSTIFARFFLLNTLVFFGLLVSTLAVQVYRYQRVSTPMERQQTKWVVFGVTLAVLGLIGSTSLYILFPSVFQVGGLSFFLLYPVLLLAPLCIPVSFGVAILRSHLWDIDTIINKALVYGGLSALLAGVYAGLIIGLESLIGLLGGTAAQNPVALVVSTLAIAALFQPVRSRIQTIIDRRFYRRKYDAEQTLTAFSATLRQEVDLERLQAHLIAVVQETMQPVHVSLWLRQPERRFTDQAHRLESSADGSSKPILD
jgi:hypothetical protein